MWAFLGRQVERGGKAAVAFFTTGSPTAAYAAYQSPTSGVGTEIGRGISDITQGDFSEGFQHWGVPEPVADVMDSGLRYVGEQFGLYDEPAEQENLDIRAAEYKRIIIESFIDACVTIPYLEPMKKASDFFISPQTYGAPSVVLHPILVTEAAKNLRRNFIFPSGIFGNFGSLTQAGAEEIIRKYAETDPLLIPALKASLEMQYKVFAVLRHEGAQRASAQAQANAPVYGEDFGAWQREQIAQESGGVLPLAMIAGVAWSLLK